MVTRSMLSRLVLTLGLLAVCAFLASTWRTPKLRKQPLASVAVALAIGAR